MEERKAEQFANCIYKWNRNQNYIYVMIVILTVAFSGLLINAVSMDYMNLSKSGEKLFWVIGILLFIGIFFSLSFYNLYVSVAGKDGKMKQSVVDTIAYHPFSIDTYFRVLNRKYTVAGMVLCCVTAVILIIGAFYRIVLTETEYEILYDIQLVTEKRVLLYMLAVVIVGIAILSVTLMIGCLGYKIQLKNRLRNLCKNQNRRKKSGTQTGNEKRIISILLIVAVICFVTLMMAITVVLHELVLPDDYEQEWIVMMHTNMGVFVSSAFGGSFVAMLSEKNRKKIKQTAIAFLLIFFVCTGYVATFYNCYYEDHFVIHTILNDKTYDWSDVKSYTVSASPLRQSVQLELQLEDDSVKVFVGEASRSDKYVERYPTDYHYVLALMEKMDSHGVPGEIRNYEKLEEYANEWWEEERTEVLAALEDMKEIAELKTTSFFFDTYETSDVEDYGEYEGHIDCETDGMFTGLFILPEDVGDAQIEEYYYKCRVGVLDNEYCLFTSIQYSEEDFLKEKERLESISCKIEGTEQMIQYSDTKFRYPAYITIYEHNYCFEYALLDEVNQTVIYVYTQFFSLFDFVPEEYRPVEFKTEEDINCSIENLNIYYKYDEAVDGYMFYGEEE